ncbi:MAG: DUF2786 domain-containing protein [Verrucomicrobiota bacterium]
MQSIKTNTVTDRIAKLLRLSESSNANEAEAAMAKAVQLAAEHDIEIGSIHAHSDEPAVTKVEQGSVPTGGARWTPKMTSVSAVIQEFTGCYITFRNEFSGVTVSFVGTADDVATAKFLWSHLTETFDRLWKIERALQKKEYNHNPNAAYRNGYFKGLAHGLRARISSEKRQFEEKSECYGLVLAGKKAAVEEFAKTLNAKRHRSKAANSDGLGFRRGVEDSREVTLAKAAIA